MPRLSLSAWILVGLGLGVFAGLFFGEPAAVLQPVADVYVRLMQMTVLPYLVVSLVLAFGQLEAGRAGRLFLRVGLILALTWALTLVVIAAMPAAFPAAEAAFFFSQSLVEPRPPFSIADLYFTANPFNALSNAVVPAVVLFSSMLGVALMKARDRETVLGPLRALNAAISRITLFVVRLTPIGVFAIGAATAGTLSGETLKRLEVYLVAFAAAALLLAFWVLPLLVTAVTPFRYREVTGAARDALLTAFVTNSAFIVLPILAERSRELLRRRGLLNAETDSAPDVLIPVLFNFPNAGKLLTLLFVPFAAWLAGDPLAPGGYAALFAAGVPSYFAKAQVALPFLLDLFGLPQDLFQLYVPTTILTGKFDSMVTAMNLLAFALLGAASAGGFLVLERRRLLRAGLAVAAGIAVTVVATGLLLRGTVDTAYHRDEVLRRMHAPRGARPAVVLPGLEERRGTPPVAGQTELERLRARRTLRVGFDPQNPPFTFRNADGQLVGLDVELAESLAGSLGVEAEFVPVKWQDVPAALEQGLIDVMPSVWFRPYWFSSVRLSDPYLTGTMALVVRDARRDEFASTKSLHRSRGLRVGVPLDPEQVAVSIRRYFGDADVTLVPEESSAAFFDGRRPDLDAYLMPAESGSAMTLLHPEFCVVVPQPDPVAVPMAFGLAVGSRDLADAVNRWIVFATSEGQVRRAYEYWVLGQGARDEKPRWSILRDVLGWGPGLATGAGRAGPQ